MVSGEVCERVVTIGYRTAAGFEEGNPLEIGVAFGVARGPVGESLAGGGVFVAQLVFVISHRVRDDGARLACRAACEKGTAKGIPKGWVTQKGKGRGCGARTAAGATTVATVFARFRAPEELRLLVALVP